MLPQPTRLLQRGCRPSHVAIDHGPCGTTQNPTTAGGQSYSKPGLDGPIRQYPDGGSLFDFWARLETLKVARAPAPSPARWQSLNKTTKQPIFCRNAPIRTLDFLLRHRAWDTHPNPRWSGIGVSLNMIDKKLELPELPGTNKVSVSGIAPPVDAIEERL
jgi:hypothetical protein